MAVSVLNVTMVTSVILRVTVVTQVTSLSVVYVVAMLKRTREKCFDLLAFMFGFIDLLKCHESAKKLQTHSGQFLVCG